MNIAIILAGGTGTRVGAKVPKQFIEINNKPILAYTVDIFETNTNIDAIEIVCHKNWMDYINEMIKSYGYSKVRWITNGGDTFQDSVINGIMHLENDISRNDTVVISFGVSPMTPQEDINDSIAICHKYGNAIAAKDIDLCTCIKKDEKCTETAIARESLKGFANPWTFIYGDLKDTYDYAIKKGIINTIDPHTTSLYLALGKKLWFSKCTSANVKITTKQDVELFKGYLSLKTQKNGILP